MTFSRLEWGTIMLFGSGLAMAESLTRTKAIDYVLNNISADFLFSNELLVTMTIFAVK